MIFCLVKPQIDASAEGVLAEVAWNDNSFKVICFNVIFNDMISALLSTHFAQISKSTSVAEVVLTFLHRRSNPFIKL